MLVIGVILLILGYCLDIGVLETIGLILAVIGGVLLALSYAGRPVGGRRWH